LIPSLAGRNETMKTYNQEEMTVVLERIDMCELILATGLMSKADNDKWIKLHDKLKTELDRFDKKNGAIADEE